MSSVKPEDLIRACREHAYAIRLEPHGDQFAADLLDLAAKRILELARQNIRYKRN